MCVKYLEQKQATKSNNLTTSPNIFFNKYNENLTL